MIYQADWYSEKLVYVATGNPSDINFYPLEHMVTVQYNDNPTQFFDQASADAAFANHDGFLETFYDT
jgi:hypothetical protein